MLKITYPRSGLSKTVDTTGYTASQLVKIYKTYGRAGYIVTIAGV